MRKVIALMHISLDGYTAGPNGELEWAIVDEEIHKDVGNTLATVDTALYGRVTYGMMESYWPTVPANPESTPEELRHARWVEEVQKIVFSRTLGGVTWNNTTLVRDDIVGEIARRKREPGGEMMIFGSPSVVHAAARGGVVDEYRIYLNPIVLGGGVPLFADGMSATLALLESKTYGTGVVGLHYRVATVGGV